MKTLLAGLLIIVALAGGARAASTDTVKGSTETLDEQIAATDAHIAVLMAALADAFAAQLADATPEQKTVEIHMASEAPETMPEIKKRGRRQVLPLRAGTCSGEFVGDEGEILTARHCVDGFDTFEVQTYDHRLYVAKVVAVSLNHDLAMIRIDRNHTPYFRLAKSVERGEKISVLGSPLGITDTLSQGVVARLEGDDMLLDCGALPGNSGGPVFNENGELVGVLNAGLIVMFGVTHLNMAQGLDAIHFFIREVAQDYTDGRR
jgi:serine protease Do